ncbi:26S proteasome non-ATPase regulatory subunit 13 homolog A-like [Humulus lupulus]|uniref:26S proteasome non-ATPase regulatory subunit 13 homolog A-like n=1 Tax=Humulus lupulus TaxID=3486 RepID=UPI002B412792|nr:26S proteasome non-ATPase regulatory subunit 13 homolog A-like [Humulus lupulus]
MAATCPLLWFGSGSWNSMISITKILMEFPLSTLFLKINADWNWFITLSAADYPLMTQDAIYYWVSYQYHKFRQEFAEFYKSALLYLAYTLVESLSESFKLDLAFGLSLSVLLGDNIYNFGELLAHPIS